MYLQSWDTVVAFETGINGDELFLAVEAELKCPFCDEIVKINTSRHSLDAGVDFLVSWKVRGVCEPRECKNCGIYSTLPDKDEKLLRLELEKEVTKEWLEEQKKGPTLD